MLTRRLYIYIKLTQQSNDMNPFLHQTWTTMQKIFNNFKPSRLSENDIFMKMYVFYFSSRKFKSPGQDEEEKSFLVQILLNNINMFLFLYFKNIFKNI
jgi:hypothetical protein